MFCPFLKSYYLCTDLKIVIITNMTDLQIHNFLLEKDIKPSVQRIAIMKYLCEHATHPTVENIFNDLHEQIPTLSRTTIYNTLKLFSEKKAVLTITIEEKNVHYDGDTKPHSHFRCTDCGKIFDLPLNENINFTNENFDKFTIEETHVYHKGICPNCQEIK